MSIGSARRPTDSAQSSAAANECLEFVRFCYQRRSVGWPELYDEMCAVAARGSYRGLGYAELSEQGICFSLAELPHLAALAAQVIAEATALLAPPQALVEPVLLEAQPIERSLPLALAIAPAA